jgi:hypothetical protein
MVSCVEMSLGVVCSPSRDHHDESKFDLTDSIISQQDTSNQVCLTELLFPRFNHLVPLLFDSVLPVLSKPKTISKLTSCASLESLLCTIHKLVGFGFKTQLFDKIIAPKFSKCLAAQSKGHQVTTSLV